MAVISQSGDMGQTLNNIVEIAVGTAHSMALAKDGTVYYWGVNHASSTEDGNPVPTSMAFGTPMAKAILVFDGATHASAVTSDGSVWSIGQNSFGPVSYTHLVYTGVSRAKAVAAGALQTSYALGETGNVFVWGGNGNREYGTAGITGLHTVALSGKQAVQIAAGYGLSLIHISTPRRSMRSAPTGMPAMYCSGAEIFSAGATTRSTSSAMAPTRV